jgi:MoaA/NifB/PqqE/SkfB family radical SAM enzyme
MNDSNKFCAAPFKEMIIDTSGELAPCCEYLNHAGSFTDTMKFMQYDEWQKDRMSVLRQKMIDGTSDAGCAHCANKESISKQVNTRKHINKKYGNVVNLTTELESLEIRFGNYCNLKCLMCGPYASSSLAEEYLRHKDTYIKNDFKYTARLKTVRWWEEPGAIEKLMSVVKKVKYLSFSGGEPLMVPEIVDVLNSANVDTIRSITCNTNMTKFNDRVLAAFNRFPRGVVHIRSSIEGVGLHNDYIRYGEKWSVISSAVDLIQQLPKINITISSVLQATTVYAAPDLIKYGKEKNIKIDFGAVYPNTGYGAGDYLTINSVHPQDVRQFQQYLKSQPHAVLQAWINKYEFDPEKHVRFRKFTEMIDGIRGTDFKTTFDPTWD